MQTNLHHHEQLNPFRAKMVSFISFLLGFSSALIVYVLSSYFKVVSGTENVSPFYLMAYILVLIGFLNFHKIIKKLGKALVFHFSAFLKIIVIVIIILAPQTPWTLPFLIIFIFFSALELVSVDVILESFSEDKKSGSIRGLQLTLMNAGFIFGPLISTRILDKYSFAGIFFVGLVLQVFIFLISFYALRGVKHTFEKKLSVIDLLNKVRHRKDILKIYYISFVLEFFYAIMVVYTPIYLINLGVPWTDIGAMFTIMLIPFVLLEYPVGKLADKKTGEKEMIIGALCILIFSVAAIFFIESKSVLVWGAVLFATRIGAALLEILRDSYFYKRVDSFDVGMIDFFRTARSIAYIVSSILAAVFLSFTSIKIVFGLVIIVAAIGFYPAFRLVDNRAEDELVSSE